MVPSNVRDERCRDDADEQHESEDASEKFHG